MWYVFKHVSGRFKLVQIWRLQSNRHVCNIIVNKEKAWEKICCCMSERDRSLYYAHCLLLFQNFGKFSICIDFVRIKATKKKIKMPNRRATHAGSWYSNSGKSKLCNIWSWFQLFVNDDKRVFCLCSHRVEFAFRI